MKLLSVLVSCVLLMTAPFAGAQEPGKSRAPLGEKPAATVIGENVRDDAIGVKFVHGSGVRLRDGVLVGEDPDLWQIQAFLDAYDAQLSRMIRFQTETFLDDFRRTAEQRSGQALHDLNLFYVVEFDSPMGAEACDVLNQFDVVELAYPQAGVEDPSAPAVTILPTPDFQNQQNYREAAPLGVDADHGETFPGADGTGITIADVETAWTDDHEDIKHKALGNFIGLPPVSYPWDHGTAVLGELVGEDNGEGVKGIAYDCDVLMSSHQGNASQIPDAIFFAAAAVGPGDVVVLEVQCYQGPPSPHPCEYDPGIFATCQAATGAGIHIFAAAGNGNNNLDSAAYGGAFDRNVRDSGAFIVGASNGSSLDKASFSNYGSRCDAHGWGYNVTTCGYGDLQGGPATQEYTATFSGTSSATPIVTGAGIQIESIHKSVYGVGLPPLTLRSLVTATGTPQGAGGIIGPRPNIKAALRSLEIPEIELTGNLTPGGAVTFTSRGTAGDFYILYASASLTAPVDISPLGELFLGAPLVKVFKGTLGAAGTDVINTTIPNDPSLSGQTAFLQELQIFGTKAGQGSFSNYWVAAIQ